MASEGPSDEAANKAANENGESQPLCEYEIIPDGDIILVAGPEKKRVRLSSHLLYTTSQVFKAMIHSGFKEGETFRQSDGAFIEIELPSDNAATFFNAFRALYCPDPTRQLSPKEVQQVAILADKYDMAGHFVYAASFWLVQQGTANKWTIEQLWQLFTASYWLKCPLGFIHFSKKLVFKKSVPLVKYVSGMPDKALGFKLCLAIESIRHARLQKDITTEVGVCLSCFDGATEGFVKPGPNCETPHYHIPS
ncbi:hypothetical protein NM208_g9402 [Fusarium decemcellulare]|uniref:Uncharacterized protein n=1 Tax=Fusarium decemcellulare TaxID=57161 RepID=A0ACC1S1T7_9HYPO|nr:hypothetical protein NM208_g9402 [Fusarium decemcellulare]